MSASAKSSPLGSCPSTPGRSSKPTTVASQDRVHVSVRARPLRDGEVDGDIAIRVNGGTCEVLAVNRGRFPFTFDQCFFSPHRTATDQAEVFEAVGAPLVDNAFLGFNSSIIAYGPTGSGKTFTIFGPQHSLGTANEGLIPRVCNSIFERIAAAEAADAAAAQSVDGSRGPATKYSLSIAVLEIYLEEVFDLLAQRRPLKVRNDGPHRFSVPGLRWVPVEHYDEIVGLLSQAEEQKTFAATAVHERSSRAHTLFQVELRASTIDATQTSRLVLADLAGSERIRVAGTDSGLSLEQATSINMSLLNLGTCIENVVNRSLKKLPTGQSIGEFRNSALTKLLREYIGGNARTAVVVTISPTLDEVSNTLQTLRFADRAKQLTNHAEINSRSVDPQTTSAVEAKYAERRKRLDEECKLEMQITIASNRETVLEGNAAAFKARITAGIGGSDAERQLRATLAEVNEVRQTRDALESRLLRLREQDADAAESSGVSSAASNKRVAELQEMLQRAESFLNAMRQDRDEEIALKNMEMAALRAEYEARIDAQSAECEQIVARTAKCHQTALAHLRASCEGQVQLLTRQSEAIDSELYAARGHIVTLEEDLACARTNASLSDQALREKSEAVFEAAERAANAELEIERLLRANDDLRRQLADRDSSKRQLTADVATLKEERQLLRDNIANMNTHFRLTQEQWEEEKQQLTSAIAEANRALTAVREADAERAEAEARRHAASDEALSAAQSRIASLESVVSESDVKLAEADDVIAALRRELTASAANSARAAALEAELRSALQYAQSTIASRDDELKALEAAHRAEFAKEANAHVAKIMFLENTLARVKADRESLLQQVGEELQVASRAFARVGSIVGVQLSGADAPSHERRFGSAAHRSSAPSAWLANSPLQQSATSGTTGDATSPPRRRGLVATNNAGSSASKSAAAPLAGMDENTEVAPRMSL